MTHLIIFGASRGLGAAFNAGLPEPGDTVWLVSRTPPDLRESDGVARRWIQADLARPEASRNVAQALAGEPLDVLIYNAGIWEPGAFGPGYDFEQVSEAETLDILAVNLTSAILCVQKLLPNLRRSANPKVILIGSISGLENNGGCEVAYDASKFGLRGAAHALREALRPDRIGVTCLNPGDLSTLLPEPPRDAAGQAAQADAIPLRDVLTVVQCVMQLSRATCIKEIDLPAMSNREA